MADNVLTRLDLQNLIMGQGQSAKFPAGRSGDALKWLAAAYQDVWDAANWTFKYVDRADWYPTTNGTANGVVSSNLAKMPSDFAGDPVLYDDVGEVVPRMSRLEFFDRFQDSLVAGSSGPIQAFTVINRQIVVGPTPDTGRKYALSYRRRVSYRRSDTTVLAGAMTQDTDYPLWDDHHFLLVLRAQVIGLKSVNDPTWPPLDQEYQGLLVSMIEDYVESDDMPKQLGRIIW